MNNAFLHPADVIEDSVESLFAAHGPQRPMLYWFLLLGAIGALVALPLIKVDVSVRAGGLVRSRSDRTELRAPISGYIDQLAVRDNAQVNAQEVLLTINDRDVAERLKRNLEQQAEHKAAVADLLLLVSSVEAAKSADKNTDGNDLSIQPPITDNVLAADFESRFKTRNFLAEYRQFKTQQNTHRLLERKARGDLTRSTILAAKGIATKQELDASKYEVERLAADSKLQLDQALAKWQTSLRDEQSTVANLATAANQLVVEQTHYVVRAPANGTLVGFSGLSIGGFVTMGQSLGLLSPRDELRVETFVSPRDVGLIRIGQSVRIQVDAFPYTQWGTLEGKVESISGDVNALQSAASGSDVPPYFQVIVQPQAGRLHLRNGREGELRKGMTLSARFLIARRSLLQLLYEKMSNWLDPRAA